MFWRELKMFWRKPKNVQNSDFGRNTKFSKVAPLFHAKKP